MVTKINCHFSADHEKVLNMFQHSFTDKKTKMKKIKTAPYIHERYLKPMGNFIFSGKIPQVFPFKAKIKSVIT